MSSIQATRMKRGMLIKMGNDLYRVLDLTHFTPGNKRGFVQARMRNIRNGQQADNKFRAEEDVERAILDERQMQYLYRDGDSFHFMETTTYEQIHLDAEVLGDNASYILPEMVIAMEFYGEEPVGIELPISVDLKVVDTTPAINRATASAQVKPATLETGLVVNVPAHVNIGDVIRVGTEDGEYQKKV
ncbi:MAG TPA: elongation factor P [Vicinamibacterales bacterium]